MWKMSGWCGNERNKRIRSQERELFDELIVNAIFSISFSQDIIWSLWSWWKWENEHFEIPDDHRSDNNKRRRRMKESVTRTWHAIYFCHVSFKSFRNKRNIHSKSCEMMMMIMMGNGCHTGWCTKGWYVDILFYFGCAVIHSWDVRNLFHFQPFIIINVLSV